MQAVAAFPDEKQMRVIDYHPEPSLTSDTEVKIRILDVGLCGTDRDIAAFDYGNPPPNENYLVIGHESLGQVVQVGSKVTNVKVDDLVVTMVRRQCPHPECLACRRNQQDFCYTGDYKERGIKEYHGFMTEFIVDDEQYLNVVPQDLRDIGVLTEPLTIAEKAVEQLWKVQERLPWIDLPQHKALVLGAGPVGQLGAMLLKVQGFETYVYSREAAGSEKAKLAESYGAVYLSSADVPLDQLTAKLGRIDVTYEATGASAFAFEVLHQQGINGVFLMTGVPGHKPPSPVDTDRLMRDLVLKNQMLLGSVNASYGNFKSAIKNLQDFHDRWPDSIKALISARYHIDEVPKLLTGEPVGIKNVVSLV